MSENYMKSSLPRQTPIRRPVATLIVGGQCRRDLRALRDRRSVSAVSVSGQCLRDLRDLRDPIFALYALVNSTLAAMEAFYTQFSTSAARPLICLSRCQPRQRGARGHRKTPAISIQCPYNSGNFR